MGRNLTMAVKLTKHKYGYRKMLGGQLIYFGHDPLQAELNALAVIAIWKRLKASGIKEWPADELAKAKAIAKAESSLPPGYDDDPDPGDPMIPIPIPPEPDDSSAMWVHDAIDKFQLSVRRRPTGSNKWKNRLCERLETVKATIPKMPLFLFNSSTIKPIVNHWKARPTYIKNGKEKPYAISTIEHHIAALKQFVDWLDLSESITWEAPSDKQLKPLFSTRGLSKSMTPVELEKASTVETFSIDELKKLWQVGSKRYRLYLCLALNCAFKQQEIADLLVGQVYFDGSPRIVRTRGKNHVAGQWPLWAETAYLLADHMKKRPKATPNDLAILTSKGNPVVVTNGKSTTDTVYQRHYYYYNRAGIIKGETDRELGFSVFENTVADLIAQEFGGEVASTFIAHGRTIKTDPIIHRYTNRRFDKVAEAVIWLGEKLSPVFV